MFMKKIIGEILVFVIIVVSFGFMVLATAENISHLREHRKFVKEHIGKTIVIQQDTLVILNYQKGRFGNSCGFTLSNGALVSEQFVKKYYKEIL